MENMRIDFELLGGIILIEAKVDGKKGSLAFDTGSMVTAINHCYHTHCGESGIEVSTYSGGIQTQSITKGNAGHLSFADITLENHPVCFLDFSYVENSLRTLREDLVFLGTIGMDILSQYRIRMDYEQKCIVLNPAEPLERSCFVDFELIHSLIVLPGYVGDRQYRFLLDSGANTCLINDSLRANKKIQDSGQSATPFLLTELSFGPQTYHDIVAVGAKLSEIKKISVDAIIGFQILSKQRVDINFSERKLFFEQR